MDADPRDLLTKRLALITSGDLARLAAAWSPAFSDELAAAHLVLAEHDRGDLSHVLGDVLDRVPELAALVADDELLIDDRRVTAERALEVLEGAVVSMHASDLLPAARTLRLVDPWLTAERRRAQDTPMLDP